MDGPFGKCLSSFLFTFQVGIDKKEMTVHSFAFAKLSQSLNALINGDMIEAKTRRVDWSDVDSDTFTRLCEYAYLRDYTPPSFRLIDGYPLTMEFSKKPSKSARKKKSSKHRSIVPIWGEPEPSPETEPTPACANEPAPEEAVEPETSLEVATSSDLELPYKERSLWTQQLRDAFLTAPLVSGSGSEDSTLPFAPPKNSGPWEDFTPVFVEQARLYALADKYGIEALGQLVLVKLYETLRSFKLYETGVTGVVEFVRFVYSNTPPGSGDNTDALRKLVTRYVVSVLGQIGENGAFKELLEEGGPFVLDFWNIIWGLDNTYDR